MPSPPFIPQHSEFRVTAASAQIRLRRSFVCLGPKRSGDVYTATDLSHLTAIAEAAARELRRFKPEEFVQVA